MATKQEFNTWYPAVGTFAKHEQDTAVRQLYDHVYDLQSRLQELHGKHEDMKAKMSSVTAENEKLKETINTRIAGKLIKAKAYPNNGDTVRYNLASGEFEFGA